MNPSIPASAVVRRLGYMRAAAVGLLTMTAGCLLFVPAAASGVFGTFLVALFVLASGITIVQVVANPLISLLGKPETASSRLTFAQAFNSLGTTIFPRVGSSLILGGLASVSAASLSGAALVTYRQEASQAIVHTYLGLAVALVVVSALADYMNPRVVFIASAGLTAAVSLLIPVLAQGHISALLLFGAVAIANPSVFPKPLATLRALRATRARTSSVPPIRHSGD